MSADNWRECPNCLKLREQEQAAANERLAQAYGKVSPEEYLALVQARTQTPPVDDTLREDYEIGIWDRQFRVYYKASCQVCGFTWDYRFKQEV